MDEHAYMGQANGTGSPHVLIAEKLCVCLSLSIVQHAVLHVVEIGTFPTHT